MVFLSTLINALFTHNGKTIIFSLPQSWLLIGGNITLESVLFGVINGLTIGALYLSFTIINIALSIKQLTRLIPKVFHPIAMTVTIALTFYPSVQTRAREIKEAQMIRGSRMKKISDWLPLLIPLLVTSLEKAILLSESMTARGFHATSQSINPSLPLVGLLSALFAFFSGWVLRIFSYPLWISLSLYGLGGAIVLAILLPTTHQDKTTNYRKGVWHPTDVVFSVIIIIFIVAFTVIWINKTLHSLSYFPYPALSFPPFHPIGLLFSALSFFPSINTNHD
jgi:energy-coupling factor transport system permease protein